MFGCRWIGWRESSFDTLLTSATFDLVKRLDKGKRFTKVSNDFLKSVAFGVPDTSFHHISVAGEERSVDVPQSLELRVC